MRTTSRMAVARLTIQVTLALTCVGAERRGRAELITPVQKDLIHAQRRLEAARERVTATAEYLTATQALRTARLSVYRACRTAHDSVARVRKEAEKAEGFARTEALEAAQGVNEAMMAAETSGRALRLATEHFLNRALLAYDVKQHGFLTFNTLTGAFDVRLDDGPAASAFSDADRTALLAGHFGRPEIDPLRLAAGAARRHERITRNYADVQARLVVEDGAGNVYLLSERFLDWATPERLAGDLAASRLKSGLSINAEIAEARRQVQLEYEDLAAWLWLRGIRDLGANPAEVVAELVRTGSYPRLGQTVKTRQVEYTHQSEVDGRTEVPADYLKRVTSTGQGQAGHEQARGFTEKRPALAIIANGPGYHPGSFESQLEGHAFHLSPPGILALPKLLPANTDPRLRRLLEDTAQHGLLEIDAAARPRRIAEAALGVRKEDLPAPGGSTRASVDLRSTDYAEIMAALVTQLALGNEKSCELNRVELDRSTGCVSAAFTLHHRHVWANLRDFQTQLQATVGAHQTELFDLADRLPDRAFDATRQRHHENDMRAQAAGRRDLDARQKMRQAAEQVAAKTRELETLAGELSRAEADLRAAAERETLARQEAQTSCAR